MKTAKKSFEIYILKVLMKEKREDSAKGTSHYFDEYNPQGHS